MIGVFTGGIFELFNQMWWGIAIGIVFVGILGRVPRELVMGMLGRDGGVTGLFRATLAGVFLDLCSHGILAVGMKLYERGASAGQVMAFLLASPWNSFSLTLILFGLIGVSWTLLFILLSLVIGIITGAIFDALVRRGQLPANPWQDELAEASLCRAVAGISPDHAIFTVGQLQIFARGLCRFAGGDSLVAVWPGVGRADTCSGAGGSLRHLVWRDHGRPVADLAGHDGY